MGYGCIPVVSDLPANREWIQDGVNGVIVNGHLTEALNRALKLNADEVIAMNQKIIERFGVIVALANDGSQSEKLGLVAYDQLHDIRWMAKFSEHCSTRKRG